MQDVKDLWRDRVDNLRKELVFDSIYPLVSRVLLEHKKTIIEITETILEQLRETRYRGTETRLFREYMNGILNDLQYNINRQSVHPVEQIHLQDKFFTVANMRAEFDMWLEEQRVAGNFPLWFVAGEKLESGQIAYMNVQDGKWYIWTQEVGDSVPIYQLKWSVLTDERFIVDQSGLHVL
jgi:hypothetical protein